MKKPKMNLLMVLILYFAIICLSCLLVRKPTLLRTYEGPLKSNGETAMLYGYDYGALLGVEEIDGKSRAEIQKENGNYKISDYMLLPGEHIVKIGGYPGHNQVEALINRKPEEMNVLIDGKAMPITMTKTYFVPPGTAIGGENYLACFGEWTLKVLVEAGHVYSISYDAVPIIEDYYSVTPYIKEAHHIKFSTDNDHIKPKNQKTVSTIVDFKPRNTSTWKIK